MSHHAIDSYLVWFFSQLMQDSKNWYKYKNFFEDTFPTPSIEYEYVWMKKYVFLAVVGLDGMAFLFCVICAFGIIIYRRHL